MHFMSNLFLVRHGQASFLETNYDKLSSKGEAQSRMLGEYWVKHGVSFDQFFPGLAPASATQPASSARHTSKPGYTGRILQSSRALTNSAPRQ